MSEDVFDPAGGALDREDAIARVRRAANPEWWRWMYARVIEVARRKPVFTTDDIERLRQERDGPQTHENRALGPLMREASKQGVCATIPAWWPSSQRVNHRRPQQIWRSLIYEGPRLRWRRPKPLDPNQYKLKL